MKFVSVTQVLSPFNDFGNIDPQIIESAAVRGSIVHMACASYARNVFVPQFKDVAAFLFQSFTRWFDANVEEVIAVEERVSDNVLKYTGTADLIVRLKDGCIWLLDIKTPVREGPTWCAQCAAYWKLNRDIHVINRIGSLRLSRKGNPATINEYVYKDDDFAAFTFALYAYRYFKGESCQ